MKKSIVELLPAAQSCCRVFENALKTLAGMPPPRVLSLKAGVYRFDKADSIARMIFVSNTISQNEDPVKKIGLLLENMEDLTVEGNGATLLMNGDMSAVIMTGCRNITLKELCIDYVRPRVSEMTAEKVDKCKVLFKPHADSLWKIDGNGEFCWVDADGALETRDSWQVVQCATADNSSNLRSVFNPLKEAEKFEVISGGIEFTYREAPPVKAGEVWQFRHPSRRANGIVIANCENVTLDGMKLFFTPGLGVVGQMSRNITIRNHRHAPAPGSGRRCSAHADCIQISSCYGRVDIGNCFFSGSQDDPVNIHGTYLEVVKISGCEAELRFCQSETWGWMPFAQGDEVCFVDRNDMCRKEFCFVAAVKGVWGDTVKITLDRDMEKFADSGHFVLENMSAYPDADVHDSVFECYPTRGLLLTSAGKCRVFNNEFRQTAARPAIHISGDANNWYESGGVRDVQIFRNRFRFCRDVAVNIMPAVPEPGEDTVHRNIRVFDNRFEECSKLLLRSCSVSDLTHDIPEESVETV
ncbi:MAG: hypothetical protein E7051_01390 [Lentisphaerae bacterium]|nr:hypothetical protein [Lentisphaerota bacterium]MBQ4329715.1 hypothetical protein [Lentisphaeria bacterium]MBR2719716.1 hypothetical protein [Lentisphaeria bacterium]